MDRRAWQATVHGVAKSWTRLSNFTFITFLFMVKVNGKLKQPNSGRSVNGPEPS